MSVVTLDALDELALALEGAGYPGLALLLTEAWIRRVAPGC